MVERLPALTGGPEGTDDPGEDSPPVERRS
jgi:hypothetical protein